MTLNPLTLLEKAINEHGSAVILNERLGLAQDQFAALDQKLSDATLLIAKHEQTIRQLQTQNERLRLDNEQLNNHVLNLKETIDASKHDDLHQNCESILAHLSQCGTSTTKNIAIATGIGTQTVRLHLSDLDDRGLVESLDAYTDMAWRLSNAGLRRMFDKGLIKYRQNHRMQPSRVRPVDP